MTGWTSDEQARIRATEEGGIAAVRRGGEPTALSRRSFPRGALVGVASVVVGSQLGGCDAPACSRGEALIPPGGLRCRPLSP